MRSPDHYQAQDTVESIGCHLIIWVTEVRFECVVGANKRDTEKSEVLKAVNLQGSKKKASRKRNMYQKNCIQRKVRLLSFDTACQSLIKFRKLRDPP